MRTSIDIFANSFGFIRIIFYHNRYSTSTIDTSYQNIERLGSIIGESHAIYYGNIMSFTLI